MKKNAFTMIELMIAIGIVMLLATMITAAAKHSVKKAQIAKCRVQMKTLEVALNQYYDTYHRWPGQVYNTDMEESGQLIYLMKKNWTTSAKNGSEPDLSTSVKVENAKKDKYYFGLISRLQGYNTRKKAFLPVQNNNPGEYTDSWGNNFTIYVSKSHNGKIVLKDSSHTGIVPGLVVEENTENKKIFHGNVLIVSCGPDGEQSNTADDDKNEDNIYSVSTHWVDEVGHEIAE